MFSSRNNQRFSGYKKDVKFYVQRAYLSPRKRYEIDNIYLPTIQKAGSQLFVKIFNDSLIQNVTKMPVLPQRDYEYGEFLKKFPRGAVIPGLYINYNAFQYFVDKPNNYKVVYVVRDPRDIVVSWYHSMLASHAPRRGVNEIRSFLQSVSYEDGIRFSINFLDEKFSFMKSWMTMCDYSYLIKFEDFIADPEAGMEGMFDYLELRIPRASLEALSTRLSFNKLREDDLSRRHGESEVSHYRNSNYVTEFPAELLQRFEETYAELLVGLGYK